MPSTKTKDHSQSEARKESLQNLAKMCNNAYKVGWTLEDVHFVAGAAWADFLDPRQN